MLFVQDGNEDVLTNEICAPKCMRAVCLPRKDCSEISRRKQTQIECVRPCCCLRRFATPVDPLPAY